MIVNVKEIVNEEESKLKEKIQRENLKPRLAVIVANNVESSKSYVCSKQKMATRLNIVQDEYYFESDVTEEELIDKIDELNDNEDINGILIQLPLYPHLNEDRIINRVKALKDVDGFTNENLGRIASNDKLIIPCTPKGILLLLERLNCNLQGCNVVILGRSKIVGMPLSQILVSKGATVTVCNSKTKDIAFYTRNADVVISATGLINVINADMIKKDSIIIDVGINRVNGKIVGDVDTYDMDKKAKYVTPVPGGVGLTTVLSLMDNLVKLTLIQKEKGGNLHE